MTKLAVPGSYSKDLARAAQAFRFHAHFAIYNSPFCNRNPPFLCLIQAFTLGKKLEAVSAPAEARVLIINTGASTSGDVNDGGE